MADNIVTRLHLMAWRAPEGEHWIDEMLRAADHIARLQHQVDRLNAALDDITHLTDDRQVHHRIKEARRG